MLVKEGNRWQQLLADGRFQELSINISEEMMHKSVGQPELAMLQGLLPNRTLEQLPQQQKPSLLASFFFFFYNSV